MRSLITVQRGLSLIELMIGLLLSSLLLLGVLQIFQSNSDTLKAQNEFSRVQESGRFAIDMLSREIRQADYWGCATGASEKFLEILLDTTDRFLNNIGSNGILGSDNVASGFKVGDREVVAGTDTLILSGAMDICGGAGRAFDGQNSGDVVVSGNCPVAAGAIVLATNCLSGSVFTVTGTNELATGGRRLQYESGEKGEGWVQNKSDSLKAEYGADASILSPYQKTYFISEGGVPGSHSLFVKGWNNPVQELVPGIEDMQLSYGLDTTGNGVINQWQPASAQEATMAQVIAVKLRLRVTSGDLRKLYISTVKVRNRGSM
ncbi:PilW family protein [uncultured Microbulbifer sp.]|uniref:PilW family protein n=1 Tax=uncultured Microbulbifer sp. TaxID=348147 RepID=UPI002630650B|nr:PilW family protein [uncultured Microbulbifer sp.]